MPGGVNEQAVCNLLSHKRSRRNTWQDSSLGKTRAILVKMGYSVYSAIDCIEDVRIVQKEGFSAKITSRSVWEERLH